MKESGDVLDAGDIFEAIVALMGDFPPNWLEVRTSTLSACLDGQAVGRDDLSARLWRSCSLSEKDCLAEALKVAERAAHRWRMSQLRGNHTQPE